MFGKSDWAHPLAVFLTVSAMALGAASCDDDSSETSVCTPGTVATCSCPDGSTGQRECLASGMGYGSCECTGGGGSGGAGGGAGGSGAAGGSGGAGGDDGALWSLAFGAAGRQQPSRVAVDSAGNVVVAGTFRSSIDLGSVTTDSAGQGDAFVVKRAPDGGYLFSAAYGGTGEDAARGLAIDSSGNIILCGSFENTVTFGGTHHSSAGAVDAFVAKLDPSGTVLWSRAFGSTGYEYASAVGVDSAGNILVGGFFQGQMSLDGHSVTAVDGLDVFVAKLDPSGTAQWAEQFGSNGDDQLYELAVDGSDAVLIGGRFPTAITFTESLTSAGGADVFVAKLDSSGVPTFGKGFGDGADQDLFGLAAASDGGVVVAGYFEGTIDFGGELLASDGGNDAFVARLDATGAHVFSRKLGGVTEQYGAGVAVTATGEALVTGGFTGTVDFGGGPVASAGDLDVFLLELTATGSFEALRRFGSSGADTGVSVAVDPLGPALLTGWFDQEISFGADTHVSEGEGDVFLAKLAR